MTIEPIVQQHATEPRVPRVKVVEPTGGETRLVAGHPITFKALDADTAGAYSLFETLTSVGQGTPLHVQRYDDEAWFVLEGTYEVRIGGAVHRLSRGGYALVPRGIPHAYRNGGDTPARLLILSSPAGIQERFFAEVGERVPAEGGPDTPAAADDPGDVERLVAAAEKYGIELPLPCG